MTKVTPWNKVKVVDYPCPVDPLARQQSSPDSLGGTLKSCSRTRQPEKEPLLSQAKIIFADQEPIDDGDPGVAAIRLVGAPKGAKSITCGVATFQPGAAIPMHTHPCEETVVMIEGQATAYVDGEEFKLGKFDSTFVPPLVPHCFVNNSDEKMVFTYFYPDVNVSRDPVEKSGPGKMQIR